MELVPGFIFIYAPLQAGILFVAYKLEECSLLGTSRSDAQK